MNRLYRRILTAFLLVAILLTTAGCGGDAGPADKEALSNQTEATEASRPDGAEHLTVDSLRQQMKTEDKSFAVAYLGYLTYDHDTLWDFIDSLGDEVLQKLPFLNQIPETNRIANAPQGEVYCFIPTDPEAVVEIYSDTTYMSDDEAFYTSVSAEPYLLVCNTAESPDCYVTITDTLDGEEFTMYWYPKLDEYLFVEQPRYANGTTGALDISPYNAMLLTYYEDMQADGDWEISTKVDLENTTWYWDGYLPDGSYYEYRVTFHKDTADVRWNPGNGETTEYTAARWDYEEDATVRVLTIDFGEFAGVRKYNLLIDWKENVMYITIDATGKDLIRDSEPLYRFLLLDQKDGAQPMDLIGTWERTQTEVDGYTEESPAGEVMIRITGTTESDLRIDYEDTQSAYRSFDDRAIFIMPGEDFMGVGEIEWMGQINFTGESANESYMLALVDGELIIRHIFTVDGTPCASYETFRRVN